MRRLVLVLGLVLLIAVPAGAGGGGGGDTCTPIGSSNEIVLLDFCFEGIAHFTPSGPLKVTNAGAVEHDLVAIDGSFRTGRIAPGEWEQVELETGIHGVYCTLHGTKDGTGMAGVLIAGPVDPVLASAAVAGPASGGTPAWLVAVALAGLLAGGLALANGIADRRKRHG